MAQWRCPDCAVSYGAWLSTCPRCRSTKGLLQVLNVCKGCTAKFAIGLPRCPHCASTDFEEDWKTMPKITVEGGPTSANAGPDEPGYMPPADGAPADETSPAEDKPADAEPEAEADDKGGDQSSPDPGTSSSTSSPKPVTSPKTNEPAAPSPARKTANRSKRAQTDSSSAPTTDGDPTEPSSATADTAADEG